MHVTGWTPAARAHELAAALADEALPAVLRVADPPAGLEPPSLLTRMPVRKPPPNVPLVVMPMPA